MKSYEFSYMVIALYGVTSGVRGLFDGITALDIASFVMSTVVFVMFVTINIGKYIQKLKGCSKRFKNELKRINKGKS